MIKNYFLIAWRNLIKDRQFTVLNVLGLTAGLTCTLLIGLWIADERGMEHYNPNDARLYQVMTNFTNAQGITTGHYTPGMLAAAMRTELPEVEDATEVLPASWFEGGGGIINFGEKKLPATPHYIDSNYFHLFTCPYLSGDPKALFADKQGVALSESFARNLFGSPEKCIGKLIHYDAGEFTGDFEVRGIFQPNPSNAVEQFDLLFNYAICSERRPGLKIWSNDDPSTFVLLRPGTNLARFNAAIAGYVHKKSGQTWDPTIFLANFSDGYLYNNYQNGVQSGGRITYVRIFTLIAAFILLIACINFMNLSTAKAVHRAKEVGIKKVVGAGRLNLILQYLIETLLLTFFALGLALMLVALVLPLFNQITGKQLTLHFAPSLALAVTGMTIFTGLIAGSYPAFYLSGFRPIAVLKGSIRTSPGELWARKGLVVFQFALSVIFIAGVLIIYRQMAFIQSRDLGYNRDHLIHFKVPTPKDSLARTATVSFVRGLKNIPGVVEAAPYSHDLLGHHGGIGGVSWPGKNPNQEFDFANIEVGYNFLETVGIRLKQGRNFSQNGNAEHEIIFNETAIKAMGLKDPVGKIIEFWGTKREIVAIAQDFNFESAYSPVKPAFFRSYPTGGSVMVRLKAGSETASIAALKKAYAGFSPGLPFEVTWLDQDFEKLYASELRVGILSRFFAGLAILISCLGLFGLAAFTAQKRKKEIGIRKVVGASVLQVAYLLSREFLVLVGVAIAIAFPLVWLGMHKWLNEFAYRIPIRADIFLLTGIAAMVITVVTISFQSIRAATANPVDSLRSE
jgi:ABC-type antimicrobial peptide transport system permease subunit